MEDLTYRVVIDTESSSPQALVVVGPEAEEKAIASLQLTADVSKEQIDEWAQGQALNYAKVKEEQAAQALKAEEAQDNAEALKAQFENHSATITEADLSSKSS